LSALVQGRVVEAGPHQELLSQGGKYAELWARQQAHVDEVYDSGPEELEQEAAALAAAAAAARGTGGPSAAAGGGSSPAAKGGAGVDAGLPAGTS
jgi:hypothetical protein